MIVYECFISGVILGEFVDFFGGVIVYCDVKVLVFNIECEVFVYDG